MWYLWAGFAFFKLEVVKNIKLNFHRYKLFGFISLKGRNWVDTGSANWKCLYSKLDKNKIKECENHFVDVKNNEVCEAIPSGECYQVFDNEKWLHIFDGANRLTNSELQKKIETIYKMLDDLLNKE